MSQAENLLNEALAAFDFGGSLPAFIAAFTRHRRLSGAELDEMQRMIDEYREGGGDG